MRFGDLEMEGLFAGEVDDGIDGSDRCFISTNLCATPQTNMIVEYWKVETYHLFGC